MDKKQMLTSSILTRKVIYVIMYGKRPIAAFKKRANADKGLAVLSDVIPTSYPVKPRIAEVLLQD